MTDQNGENPYWKPRLPYRTTRVVELSSSYWDKVGPTALSPNSFKLLLHLRVVLLVFVCLSEFKEVAMSQDFLSADNNCGQTILKLVSRGNAIIAELLRLSQFIPPVFKLETKDDQEKYKHILPDFHYFECPDFYENRIDANPVSMLNNYNIALKVPSIFIQRQYSRTHGSLCSALQGCD